MDDAVAVVDHAVQTAYSDPREWAMLFDDVDPSIEAVSVMARNVVAHYRAPSAATSSRRSRTGSATSCFWDAWGAIPVFADDPIEHVDLVDEVARLMRSHDDDVEAEHDLLALYRTDDRLHPGPRILSTCPTGAVYDVASGCGFPRRLTDHSTPHGSVGNAHSMAPCVHEQRDLGHVEPKREGAVAAGGTRIARPAR